MRNAIAQELVALAEADPRIMLLSGDIGNRLFDPFKERFADRFVNCGVAEANMIGAAAGLAMSGMRPVVYTIAPFVTLRCLEQIRIDLCYHNQPVVLVGTGAGLSYASLGATHHALEDLAALRAMPGMQVLAPADAAEARSALSLAVQSQGPTYLRIGKKGEPGVHQDNSAVAAIGRTLPIRDGEDAVLVGVGPIVAVCLEAAEMLAAEGWSVGVESLFSVKPLDGARLATLIANTRLVAVVEEHSTIGGAGSAIAEWQLEHRVEGARLLSIGTADRFLHRAGSQDWARREFGLDPLTIAARVGEALKDLRLDKPAG